MQSLSSDDQSSVDHRVHAWHIERYCLCAKQAHDDQQGIGRLNQKTQSMKSRRRS